MAETQIWIGIDGGGTKTRVYVIDKDQKLLAESVSGCSNKNSVGEAMALQALGEGVDAALSKSGRSVSDIVGICAGISGVDREADKALMNGFFNQKYPSAHIQLYNDGVLALSSGTEGVLHGIVVISGTGTISVGFNSKRQPGVQKRASGWGPLLGEDGSGYTIGNDALVAVAREADHRGAKTVLTERVLSHLNLQKAEDLIPWRYSDLSWSRPASITPLVFEAANEGDQVAISIVKKAVNGLAEAIEAVWRVLEFEPNESVPIVFAGGNLTFTGSILCSQLKDEIIRRIPAAQVTLPTIDPAMAAALLALKHQTN